MAGGLERATMKRHPPNGTGESLGGAWPTSTLAIGAATSAATAIRAASAPPLPGFWMTFTPSTDCHVRFGRSNLGNATANDELWPAKVPQEVFIELEVTHFRVIQDTAAGTMFYRRSSP